MPCVSPTTVCAIGGMHHIEELLDCDIERTCVLVYYETVPGENEVFGCKLPDWNHPMLRRSLIATHQRLTVTPLSCAYPAPESRKITIYSVVFYRVLQRINYPAHLFFELHSLLFGYYSLYG